MIIGTHQKISRYEDCSLSLSLNDKQLRKTENEKLFGIHIDPNLSWSIQVEDLRKKLLERIAQSVQPSRFRRDSPDFD